MNDVANEEKLTPKDFASDQEVRWCPGCGDYAILKSMQRTLPELGARPETTVFVSGIGCSSRFPYYMSTYGFHTIHGRAPAIATGVKLANPELDVWVITGDGDGLSIGGNHLLHALRRNVDLNILLFNNEIYGLTKGQYSPTSRPGTRSPSTPLGSFENAVSACSFALGAGAKFVARAIDTDLKHMPEVFTRAYEHAGASFVEIFQNCIVYNDGVFADFSEKAHAADTRVYARHGEPLRFGEENQMGLRLNSEDLRLEVVTIGKEGVGEDDIVIHDETNPILAQLLVSLVPPRDPMVLGVIFAQPGESFERATRKQIEERVEKQGVGDLESVFRQGRTWEVI